MKKIITGGLSLVALVIIILLIIFVGKKSEAPAVAIPQEEPGELSGVLDLETSVVTYTGFGVGKQHVGTFALSDTSTFSIGENGELQGGTLVFDMTGITSDTPAVTNHLMSSDFFEVEQFPTASYMITSVIPTPLDPDHDIIINGDLTIKGTTLPHNVVATYNPGTGLAQFSTTIDRTKWGISFNSSKLGEFGDSLIEDSVQIDAMIDID